MTEQLKEDRHANGKPVGDLLEHARLSPVGYHSVNFKAANDRAGMQDQRPRPGAAQALRRELIEENVVVE